MTKKKFERFIKCRIFDDFVFVSLWRHIHYETANPTTRFFYQVLSTYRKWSDIITVINNGLKDLKAKKNRKEKYFYLKNYHEHWWKIISNERSKSEVSIFVWQTFGKFQFCKTHQFHMCKIIENPVRFSNWSPANIPSSTLPYAVNQSRFLHLASVLDCSISLMFINVIRSSNMQESTAAEDLFFILSKCSSYLKGTWAFSF